MPSRSPTTDVYPSILWITLPPALLLSAYLVRRWYLARRLKLHGIGKGAPGFQTNVRRIRVTPEIAARIRRGEEVSPEEITRAAAEAEKDEARQIPDDKPTQESHEEPVNEWLPATNTGKKRPRRKKK